MDEGTEDQDLLERDREFYGAVREYLVLFLLFSILFFISSRLVLYFKRKREKEDYFSAEEDGPYQFSLFLCMFTLAVSLAAICLLPFSIFTCEVFLRYPNNYYLQWLNTSLLKLVWNWVFFFSNFCLLCMMPFVYFFMEAEGFSGWRTGLHSRVLETLVMVGLLLSLLFFSVWVISKWFRTTDGDSYLNIFSLLYSFLSLCGVLSTLLGLPVGIEQIILWLGNQLVLPKADDRLDMLQMEEDDLKRRLGARSAASLASSHSSSPSPELIHRRHVTPNGYSSNASSSLTSDFTGSAITISSAKLLSSGPALRTWSDSSSPLAFSQEELEEKLTANHRQQRRIRRRFASSSFYWTMFFSLCTLFVLFLTGIALLSAGQSFLRLLFSPDALAVGASDVVLGHLKGSQSVLGALGAVMEMAIALFFAFSSLIGVYTSDSFRSFRPQPGDTPLALMIANCNLVLLLSSALPVLIRSLGISRFDLVGMFGNLHWLSSWYLVAMYHLLFFMTIIYVWTRRVTRSVVAKVGTFFNLIAHKKVYFNNPLSPSDSLRSPSHSQTQLPSLASSPPSILTPSGSLRTSTTATASPLPFDLSDTSCNKSPIWDSSRMFSGSEAVGDPYSLSTQSLSGQDIRDLQDKRSDTDSQNSSHLFLG